MISCKLTNHCVGQAIGELQGQDEVYLRFGLFVEI